MIISFVTGGFSEQYEPTIENVASKTIRFRKVLDVGGHFVLYC